VFGIVPKSRKILKIPWKNKKKLPDRTCRIQKFVLVFHEKKKRKNNKPAEKAHQFTERRKDVKKEENNVEITLSAKGKSMKSRFRILRDLCMCVSTLSIVVFVASFPIFHKEK
jgi:hypothetical protein